MNIWTANETQVATTRTQRRGDSNSYSDKRSNTRRASYDDELEF